MKKTLIYSCAGLIAVIIITSVIVSSNNTRQKEKETDLALLRFSYNTCLNNAENTYNYNWEGECQGMDREVDCRLPKYNADRLDQEMKDNKASCFDTYKLETSLIK